jgi:hypothetical protein
MLQSSFQKSKKTSAPNIYIEVKVWCKRTAVLIRFIMNNSGFEKSRAVYHIT